MMELGGLVQVKGSHHPMPPPSLQSAVAGMCAKTLVEQSLSGERTCVTTTLVSFGGTSP